MAQAWDRALDSGMIPASAQNWWRLVHRNSLQSRGKLVAGRHIGQQKRVLTEEEVGLTLADLHDRAICPELVADVLTLYLWTGCRAVGTGGAGSCSWPCSGSFEPGVPVNRFVCAGQQASQSADLVGLGFQQRGCIGQFAKLCFWQRDRLRRHKPLSAPDDRIPCATAHLPQALG